MGVTTRLRWLDPARRSDRTSRAATYVYDVTGLDDYNEQTSWSKAEVTPQSLGQLVAVSPHCGLQNPSPHRPQDAAMLVVAPQSRGQLVAVSPQRGLQNPSPHRPQNAASRSVELASASACASAPLVSLERGTRVAIRMAMHTPTYTIMLRMDLGIGISSGASIADVILSSKKKCDLMYRSPSYNFSIVFPSSNVVPAENVTTE
jgi:hypothetical protein